jgi:4-amino-4-deoxy-L-arabinose transferase-like glycosyltransferase
VAAFYPEFSFVAAVLYSENLFNFLLALGMLMLIKISTEEARTWEKLVAGICLALAALARLEAASLFPLVVVWIFWLTGFKLVDTIKLGAFLLLPGILLVSIWAVRNYYAMHAFIPATTSGGVTLFGVHNDTTFNDRSAMGDWIGARWLPNWDELGSMPEIERDRALFQMALVSIRRNLARLPALEAYKLHNFVLGISPGKVVQRFPIVFFAITGLITSWWVARRKCSILYVLLLYYLTNALVFYTSERLRTGVEPYLFILAVFGAFEYWGLLANYRASAQIARQQK